MMNIILIILAVFVALRTTLPWFFLRFVNKKINRIGNFHGHVAKLKVGLLKSTVYFEDVFLRSVDDSTGSEIPFLAISGIELVFQWRALFRRSIFGKIILTRPVLELTNTPKNRSLPENKNEKAFKLKKELQDLSPFDLDIDIVEGEIRYHDITSKVSVDIILTNFRGTIIHFSNIPDLTKELPAEIKIAADVYEGALNFVMNVDPIAESLTFDMNADITNINLVLLNDFLRAHAKIDVNKGTFGMYTEVAARNGEFKGYIKPIIKELDLIGAPDKGDGFFSRAWEGFVAVAYQVLKNKTEDQVATKITIEGKLDNPHINIFSAVVLILKNAFIHALQPSIEDIINLGSVKDTVSRAKGFVKNLFKK